MPTCVMMIGPPCSGKSTLAKHLQSQLNIPVVSSDVYIERLARIKGTTYSDEFSGNCDKAIKLMNKKIERLIRDKKDFIWDQTNISMKARKKKLARLLQNDYRVAAFAMEISKEYHEKLIDGRKEKVIDKKIIDNFRNQYEQPSEDEGFEYVKIVNAET